MSEIGKVLQKNSRAASDELLVAMVSELRHLYLTQSDKLEMLAGNMKNHVLLSLTMPMPSDAYKTFGQLAVPAGTVIVFNYSATNTMTLQVGSGGGSNPGQGVGIWPVKPARWLAVPCAAHEFTVYGTVGDTFGVQALTSMSFGGGVCA